MDYIGSTLSNQRRTLRHSNVGVKYVRHNEILSWLLLRVGGGCKEYPHTVNCTYGSVTPQINNKTHYHFSPIVITK